MYGYKNWTNEARRAIKQGIKAAKAPLPQGAPEQIDPQHIGKVRALVLPGFAIRTRESLTP